MTEGGRRRPRVVVLDHCAQLSGAELALCRILPHVRDADVHVILGEHGPLEAELSALGVSTEVMPLPATVGATRRAALASRLPVRSSLATVSYVRGLRRRLRELQPDVIHTSSNKAHVYGGLAARSLSVPQLWHARDRLAREYLPGLAYVVTKVAASTLPSYFIANSHSTLLTIPRWRRSRAWVLPEAVEHREDVHPQPGGPGLRIGFLGRLTPWKGQHVFLRAFATAFADRPDIRGLVVGAALFGEDDYERSLHELVQELGLAGRIDFTGWVRDTSSLLAQMDVLVHASTIPEPFGQVVIEGMAAGLPVIASAAGGPAEIITDGHDGLLSPPGDVPALARRMSRLADDPELRAGLAARARRSAERYRPEAIAQEMTHVYDSVVG
jgi:glycosyltransferase involved in cell wall biosynthesis